MSMSLLPCSFITCLLVNASFFFFDVIFFTYFASFILCKSELKSVRFGTLRNTLRMQNIFRSNLEVLLLLTYFFFRVGV